MATDRASVPQSPDKPVKATLCPTRSERIPRSQRHWPEQIASSALRRVLLVGIPRCNFRPECVSAPKLSYYVESIFQISNTRRNPKLPLNVSSLITSRKNAAMSLDTRSLPHHSAEKETLISAVRRLQTQDEARPECTRASFPTCFQANRACGQNRCSKRA